MKIESIKQLETLLKVCQKMGVEAMEVDNLKFNLKPMAKATRQAFTKASDEVVNQMFPEANMKVPTYMSAPQGTQPDVIKSDALTEDELLFYSARAEMTGEKQGT